MKALVLYDSGYGNTAKIAETIGKSIQAKILPVKNAALKDLKNVKLIVVGSPTYGGRPTEPMQKFLDQIPSNGLNNIQAAAFDTRLAKADLNFALKLLIKTIGMAAPKIAVVLSQKGAKIIASPEGFIVKGRRGPLAPGELDRAAQWLKNAS